MQELIATLLILIICLAFWGYGTLILKPSSLQKVRHLGISTAVGISVFIAWCGQLELFHLAGSAAFKAFFGIGILLSLLAIVGSILGRIDHDDISITKSFSSSVIRFSSKALAIALCSGCLFITFSFFYHLALNQHDDYSGYLVLAKRILQEGFQGGDPFNDRSIEQGFGAGNYLIAYLNTFLPVRASHLADAGIGLALLILITFDAYRRSKAPYALSLFAIVIIVWCVVAIHSPIVNISPLLVAAGLFIAIISYYVQSNFAEQYFDHIVLALMLSSLLVLKGNYVIPVCATIVCIYLSRVTIIKPSRVFIELGIFSLCMLLFTMPWMIANWQFAKTPFYPLLGHGLVTPNALGLASFDLFADAILVLVPFYIILASLLFILYRFKEELDMRFLFFITTLSSFIIALSCALTMTSAGSLTRYSYVSLFGPIGFLTLFILFLITPKRVLSISKQSIAGGIVLIVLSSFAIPQFFYATKRGFRDITNVLVYSTRDNLGELSFVKNQQRFESLQNSIPLHSKVLVRLDLPFLLNFQNHRFHVMDWPGNVGPAPGVPFDQPPEALAQYLRGQGIDHIAYSYGNQALFSQDDPELASRINHPNPWIHTQALRTFAVQSQIESLGQQYPRIFDNGHDFVINISKTKAP